MVYGRYNDSIHGGYFMVYKPTFTSLGGPILQVRKNNFLIIVGLAKGWGLQMKQVEQKYLNFKQRRFGVHEAELGWQEGGIR